MLIKSIISRNSLSKEGHPKAFFLVSTLTEMAMKTTQIPAGQQKAHPSDVKHKTLQHEENGPCLHDVSLELGGSTTALLPWKRQRNPQHQQAAPTFASNEVDTRPPYGDRFHRVTHQVMENGQPLGLVTDTSGVVGATLHRWKNQSNIEELLTTTIDPPVSGYTDEDKEKALRLLHSGKSISQVSVSLGIPNVLVRRWWLHQNVSGTSDKVDGRRLYDDAFKAAALRQIHQGVSIRQLAKSLGITEVTLHKWRKKAPLMNEQMADEFMTSEPSASSGIRADEPSVERIACLEQQLRKVEQERDTLKKAIQILMRAS